MVINKFPNREVYEKIKEKGSLGADDVNVLEDYPGLEWKGEYSSTATYVKGDIVYYENMLYVMASASVIGAIPGIDDDWIDFAKRSVTSSDVTNALGFTPADSTKVLPLSGGTLTGNLTGKYIIGTWLQTTAAGHLATTPTKIPVFDDRGWIYYRTPAEILKDIGASSGYTLTEADKTEIAGKVVADGTEFTLSDFPTALKNPAALTFAGAVTGTYDGSEALTITIPEGGSGGSSGGGLRKMSAVARYIGIPVAELPQDGTVWMCISKGDGAELYTGTVTIEGGSLMANNLIAVSSGSVIQLNQATTINAGFVIYGMSATEYVGVWQEVEAEGTSINWRGEWAETTKYSNLDVVSYEGSSYIFASDTPAIGAIPEIDEEWQLITQKGLSPGVTGATVGQIAKIAAVDASGKPTAWEPVDMPSGGGREWVEIGHVTTEEDSTNSTTICFTTDVSSTPLELRGVLIICRALFNDTATHNVILKLNNAENTDHNYLLYKPILRNGQNCSIFSEFLRIDGINSVAQTSYNSGNIKQNGGCNSEVVTWSPVAAYILDYPARRVTIIIPDAGMLSGSTFDVWGIKA